MCHIFPCATEKPAFPSRDASIDKKNLFLQVQEWFPVIRTRVCKKSRFQLIQKVISNSNSLWKQTLKSRTVQMKLWKENNRVQLSLYILKLSIFSSRYFCNSCSFSLFHFLLEILFFYCTYHLYIHFLRSCKTNTKC